MRRGHKTLRTPAGKIVAQRFGRGLGVTCHHVHAGGRERLTEQIRHAVGTLRAGQKHHEALPFMHELRHARGEKRRRAGQIAFRKGDALGSVRGAGGLERDDALHVSLRHAEKFPVVVQIFRRGEGKPGKIGRRVDVEIAAGERALVPAAEGKGAAQGAAQGFKTRSLQPFGKRNSRIAAAFCVKPGVQPRGRKRRSHDRASSFGTDR